MRRGDEWLATEMGRIREGLASIQATNHAILQNQTKLEARMDQSAERIRTLEETTAKSVDSIDRIPVMEQAVRVLSDWKVTQTSSAATYRKLAFTAGSLISLGLSVMAFLSKSGVPH